MYVVATKVNGTEEYMRETTGDDCFSDDLSYAILYEFQAEIPPLHNDDEYIVEVVQDDEGCIWPYRD